MRGFGRLREIPSALIALSLVMVLGLVNSDPLHGGPVDEIIKDLQALEAGGKKPSFSVKLKVQGDKTNFQPGDTISFTFETDKDCYLYLIDQGTSKANTLIFPNEYKKSAKVTAGTTYKVPPEGSDFHFKITQDSKAGLEEVIALASAEPIEALEKLLGEANFADKGPVLRIKNPRRVMKDIVAELGGAKSWGWERTAFYIESSQE